MKRLSKPSRPGSLSLPNGTVSLWLCGQTWKLPFDCFNSPTPLRKSACNGIIASARNMVSFICCRVLCEDKRVDRQEVQPCLVSTFNRNSVWGTAEGGGV